MQAQDNSAFPNQTTRLKHLGIKLLQRSWWGQWIYPLLFLLAMVLSLATYLTLDSIEQSVDRYVADNQRALVGGDLVLSANRAWPNDILSIIADRPEIEAVFDYQFNAMISRQARPQTEQDSGEQALLARIKAVSEHYPLFGEVGLASKQPLWQQLTPHTAVVETQVLTRLNVDIGDEITIGEATFTIVDELLTEPDRPLTAFGFGARVLIGADDLAATNLLGQRSRVNYRIELAGPSSVIEQAKAQLTPVATTHEGIELSLADDTNTSISSISGNVLLFLKLLVIAVLFLSAVALHGVIKAFVYSQQTSNAIRRALGEPIRAIKSSYYVIVLSVGVLACVISVLVGFLMLEVSQQFLIAILPADIDVNIALISVVKISVIAFAVILLVTLHSLHAILYTKPWAVLQQAKPPARKRFLGWWYILLLLAGVSLLWWEFDSLATAIQILLGMGALLGGLWIVEKVWVWLLNLLFKSRHGWFKKAWILRMAVHNLSRKGNQTALFFITIALSIAILSMVSVINHSLRAQFIQAYPDNAPNLFLLDIQRHQHQALNALFEAPITYYPVVRARITAVNDTPITDIEVSKTQGDDPTRVFNLSYRDEVMTTEFIKEAVLADQMYADIAHNAPQPSTQRVVPMSILDTAAELLGADLGDQIHFNVQGIPLIGQITSIRQRYERGPNPFFYFLFEPEVLADAPQLQFATAKVNADDIAAIQTELAREFPAITTIDGGRIAQQVQQYVAQMRALVRVFTLLTVITGLIVLLTSLLSTSQDRLRDSASFRLLGMKTADLYKINIYEIGLLGMSAALFALLAATIGAYLLITYYFEINFGLPWIEFALGAILWFSVLLIIAIVYVRLVIRKGIMARVRQMI